VPDAPFVGVVEGEVIPGREDQRAKRNAEDCLLESVDKAELELALPEIGIPADPADQRMMGCMAFRRLPDRTTWSRVLLPGSSGGRPGRG
jgi:hypothetical protein